jgi:hypothetical protein
MTDERPMWSCRRTARFPFHGGSGISERVTKNHKALRLGGAASDDRERKENKMLRGFKLTAGVLCVVIPAALSGCADTIYPRLPALGQSGGNLLTPTEQEKTIKDLTSEQKSHGAEAAKAIEKRE